MRRTGARSPGRTRGRGREPAGAEDGEFVFVSTAPHLVRVRRRVRPRDRKELGFWGKMNIHEARKLGTLSLAEREVEAASWRVQRTENSFLYNVRRVWFASGVGFDHGIEKTGFLVQNEYSWPHASVRIREKGLSRKRARLGPQKHEIRIRRQKVFRPPTVSVGEILKLTLTTLYFMK